MVRVDEKEVWTAIKKYIAKMSNNNSDIKVSLLPIDIHREDSPDFILWLEVNFRFFAQDLRIRIPIPIEAEVSGIHDAMEDLKKFIEREKYPLEIPFLVISASGYHSVTHEGKLPVLFDIKQFPKRLLKQAIE